MLDFFGHETWGAKVIDCIEEMLVQKVGLTVDQGGTATTSECGDAFLHILEKCITG